MALEAYPRLEQVYETLIRRTEAADEKVQLLQRHAALLETKAARPSEALDRLLRAINLTPGDDALLERAETLAVATGRAADLLPALDRRAGRQGVRLHALLLLASLITLPIVPGTWAAPAMGERRQVVDVERRVEGLGAEVGQQRVGQGIVHRP